MEILILGGGYAGLRATLDLVAARRAGRLAGATVTLVDRNDYHQVVTWLHQLAADSIDPDGARVPLASLWKEGDVRLQRATVRGIAPREKRVLLEGGGMLAYDRLVVALGSVTYWPPIEGLQAHALPIRWWSEAVAIRQAVRAMFARAAQSDLPSERRRLLTIVVAGGGYTGCQLAGELAHWLPELADTYGLPLVDITLQQIEARERLLPGWEPRMSREAQRILQRKGVEVRLDSPLERLDGTTMTIAGRAAEPYGVLVWAGGVGAPPMLAESGFATGVQGRVKVDRYLRATTFPDVYLAGDSALWMQNGRPLPATASYALRQGAYVADALLRERQGTPLVPYEPVNLGLVVSLGGNDGVGNALGVPLYGMPAGLLKEGIEAWYLTTIGGS